MNNLNQQKFMTLFNDMLKDRKSYALNSILETEKGGDEVDQVNAQKDQALNMRLDERNILFLRKVKEAKQKIIDGSYGVCEECGDDIAQKRLLARPMASLCIGCQEEKERNEFGSFQKRRDLAMSKFNSEASEISEDEDVKKFSSVKDIKFESVIES